MWIMGGPTQEISKRNNISKWPRVYSCDISAKNVVALYPLPKNLPEAILKSSGPISLTEEISRQPSIDCVTWLLVINLV